jgi:hypothetical protein
MGVPNRFQLVDAAICLNRLEAEFRQRQWRYATSRLTPDEHIKLIYEENERALLDMERG